MAKVTKRERARARVARAMAGVIKRARKRATTWVMPAATRLECEQRRQ